jgi:hypothetical protein
MSQAKRNKRYCGTNSKIDTINSCHSELVSESKIEVESETSSD